MSQPTQSSAALASEQPIVIHGPPTGDIDRVTATVRPLPPAWSPDALPTATTTRAAPASYVSTAPATERVFGLDVLRGILLLAMNFTFTIPPSGPFAKWMYHTQVPPSPTAEYVNVAGLTWQDFLFAMFVFTMAAAIPVAMNPRLEKGKPYPEVLWVALRRAALLLVFALVIAHVNPYWTQDYTKRGNLVAIVGFLVAFAVYIQPPRGWNPTATKWLKRAGWVGVAFILFVMPQLYGQELSVTKRDYIMAALAFCTLAGTAVWVFTRRNVAARMGVFAVLLAGKLLAPHVVWVGTIWSATPFELFYQPWYLELMLLVIPGTIVGDLIWRWMRRDQTALGELAWSKGRLAALAVIGASFPVILSVGLYERRYPLATTIVVTVVSALMLALTRGAAFERDQILASLTRWSAGLLVAGMLFEPLEGGIKKDPQTVGFLLLMAGSSTALLVTLLICADTFKARALQPLALIGQNALFAYVVLMLVVLHVLWLAGIGDALTSTWQLATVRSIALTILAAAIVWFATKKRLIWKT